MKVRETFIWNVLRFVNQYIFQCLLEEETIDQSYPRLCQSCFTLVLRIEVDLILLSRFGLDRFDQEIGREVG